MHQKIHSVMITQKVANKGHNYHTDYTKLAAVHRKWRTRDTVQYKIDSVVIAQQVASPLAAGFSFLASVV